MKKLLTNLYIILFFLSSLMHTTKTTASYTLLYASSLLYLNFYTNTPTTFDAIINTNFDRNILSWYLLNKIKYKKNYERPSYGSSIYKLYEQIACKFSIDPKKGLLFIKNDNSPSRCYTFYHKDQFIIELDSSDIVNRSIYWTAFIIAHELSHYKQWSEQNYNLAINIKKGWLPSVFSRLPVNKLPTLATQAKYLYYTRQNEFDADLRAVKLLKNTHGAYEFCNFWFAITKGLKDREKKIPATKHWYSNLIDFCYSSYINPFFTRYPSFTTHPSFQARLNFIKKHTSDDPWYNHQYLFDENLDLEGVLTLKKTPFIYKVCIYQCKATQTKHRTRLKFLQKYASHLYHTSPTSSVK